MDLPTYLHPQHGGWRLEDALSLWLLVHYGINRSDPDTPEIRRLRLQARREVETLASELPDQLKSPPVYVRRVHRDWGGASDQWPRQTRNSPPPPPPRTWVTTAALAGLCRQSGHVPPWEQQTPTAGRQPPDAVVPVVTKKTKPTMNAEAYAFIAVQLAEGMDLGEACQAAAIKFPRGDEKLRKSSLYNGYKQLMKNHTE